MEIRLAAESGTLLAALYALLVTTFTFCSYGTGKPVNWVSNGKAFYFHPLGGSLPRTREHRVSGLPGFGGTASHPRQKNPGALAFRQR